MEETMDTVIENEVMNFIKKSSPKIRVDSSNLMDDYQRRIEHLSKSKSNFRFNHIGERQALIVLMTIINAAKESLKLICESPQESDLNRSDFLIPMDSFLRRGGSLDIIFDSWDKSDSSLLRLLRSYDGNQKVRIKAFIDPYRLVLGDDLQVAHLSIADAHVYRVETDIVNRIATGSFNDPSIAESLNTVFDGVIDDPSRTEEINFESLNG